MLHPVARFRRKHEPRFEHSVEVGSWDIADTNGNVEYLHSAFTVSTILAAIQISCNVQRSFLRHWDLCAEEPILELRVRGSSRNANLALSDPH